VSNDKISLIDPALQQVEAFAGRLASGDEAGYVRRSVAELCRAWASQQGIEPAVDRVQQSLRWLKTAQLSGRRRDCVRESPSVDRLDDVIHQRLIPALRRAGPGPSDLVAGA